MPAEQEAFHKAVDHLLEIAMFENWLRFYFIHEEDGQGSPPVLAIRLPAKSLARIRDLYPALAPMAESLDGKPIDFETSRNAVLKHILMEVDGKGMPRDTASSILQSQAFQIKLQMFHLWEQMHEDQLDARFMDFGMWRDLFAQWLLTPGARKLATQLGSAG